MTLFACYLLMCFLTIFNLTVTHGEDEEVKAVFSVQLDIEQPVPREPVVFSWNLIDTLNGYVSLKYQYYIEIGKQVCFIGGVHIIRDN